MLYKILFYSKSSLYEITLKRKKKSEGEEVTGTPKNEKKGMIMVVVLLGSYCVVDR